jgi:hypothetical protein
MTQIGHLVVTRDVAIERPSDRIWFHFEIYKLNDAEWGFNLWRANGDSARNVSDPNWRSDAAVLKWLEDNIENWDIVPGCGWCVTDRVAPTIPRI